MLYGSEKNCVPRAGLEPVTTCLQVKCSTKPELMSFMFHLHSTGHTAPNAFGYLVEKKLAMLQHG